MGRGVDRSSVLLWAPVLVIGALSASGLGAQYPWAGPPGTALATSALLVAPLLLRRRRPLLAVVLVALALIVQTAVGGALNLASLLTVLVMAYAVGRHADRPALVLGPVLLLAGIVVASRAEFAEDPGTVVFPMLYVVVGTGFGLVVRRLSDQARDLRRLNESLSHDRDMAAQLAIAGERVRLSRELHDSLAHALTVTVVQAEDCEELIALDPERAREVAVRIQEVARSGLADLRDTVRILRDEGEEVRAGPGLAEIPALAGILTSAGLEVDLRTSGALDRVSPEAGATLYRVAQEGLTHVLRHSAARAAQIRVDVGAAAATLSVLDRGPASEPDLPTTHRGLAGLEERLVGLGGHLVTERPGDGFRLLATVPVRSHP